MLEKRKVGTEAKVGQFTKKIGAGFCESSSSTSPSSLYYSHHHDRHHHCGRTIDKEDHQEDRFGKPATRTWANSAFTQVQRFSCSISSKKMKCQTVKTDVSEVDGSTFRSFVKHNTRRHSHITSSSDCLGGM